MSAQPPADRRPGVWLFACLYFSEGAPIGFIWWALPTLLRTEGVAVERITTLTALLVLPWTAKFLWAPAIDAMRSARWGFRHWAMAAQFAMGACLLPLLWFDPVQHLGVWIVLLVLHAFFAATQDVAIDALAVSSARPEQRGWLNGAMQAGMLLGRSLFGGGAIWLASQFGWHAVLLGLLAAIWISLGLLWRTKGEPARAAVTGSVRAQFQQSLRRALSARTTWLGLGFALLAGAGFEAFGALAGPFLVDSGVSANATGFFFGVPVVGAMLIGGLIGGRVADGLGRRRAVVAGMTVLTVTLCGVAAGHHARLTGSALMILMTTVYLGVGFFTAASYALFMDLTDPRLGATQFSAFMAATNACEAWAAWLGGRIAGGPGYAATFVIMPLLALIALLFLRALPRSLSGQGG
ncbi:MAG: MFS transporter [Opitutaceae bacterium]|nr:MFS transporter [Cephaloticoccus sp.]MCP5529383.1 MFS transporter [Opitutaceae bacterium]